MKRYKHIPTGNIATKNEHLKDDYTCGSHIPAWVIESGGKDWELVLEPTVITSVKNCHGYEFKIGDPTDKGKILGFKINNNSIEAIIESSEKSDVCIDLLEKK